MISIISMLVGKMLDKFLEWTGGIPQRKESHQEDYLDAAMGSASCLGPGALEPEAVSLDSLVRRTRIYQKTHPHPDFPTNKDEVEVIAERMVKSGKLERGKYSETYKRVRK